ncbi:conserved hypothetical protein [Xanthomonas citri pv. fuscans]|nr:conserved hypothetical protein [Xanthomonas citri pv. fuscans]
MPRYQDLEALRLVVNVFKHGEGQSFEDLKQRFPRFIPELGSGESWGYVDYTHLRVTDEHLNAFSEAIVSFWEAIPLQLSVKEGVASLDLPAFYARAMRQDGCPTVAAGPSASTTP